MSQHRLNVMRAYRELCWLAARLPSAKRESALAEARASIRANAGETDPGRSSDQLKELWARVSFLRVVGLASARRRRGEHALSRARR
jgi:hypothetical protein